jgi:NADH-ubiquinone oxidoreductase chain 4
MSSWVLLFHFSTTNLIGFYLSFEASLVPITILILGWGSQPERLKASMILLLYTVCSSIPLLILIISIIKIDSSFVPSAILSSNKNAPTRAVPFVMVSLVFLVKFPIFFLHLWLPKAHVEAPVIGSIILAAILLKIGGYGLQRFHFLLSKPFSLYVSLFSLLGGLLVSIICLQLKDIKIIVAYSSIRHIAVVIPSYLVMCVSTQNSGLLIMVAHALASSGLFAAANVIYEKTHSRNKILQRGTLSVIPLFSLL